MGLLGDSSTYKGWVTNKKVKRVKRVCLKIHVRHTFSWSKHIENLCSKLAQKISVLRRIKQKVPQGLTIVYLPDYYTATYRLLYHGMGLCA